ncbi:MAG: fluoride efflux transporter CrcB [Desulfobacteraceae bacterium]
MIVQKILLVGVGGFIGSVLRYLLAGWSQALFKTLVFPFGTFVVNVSGCLVIGALAGWTGNFQFLTPQVRLFLLMGVLGSFTTFSTFGYETMAMLKNGDLPFALLNVFTHVILGTGAAFAGFFLTCRFFE